MSFVCPHCGIVQAVTDKAFSTFSNNAYVGQFAEMANPKRATSLHVDGAVVRCANNQCSRVTVNVTLGSGEVTGNGIRKMEGSEFHKQRLYPRPSGRPFPEHVPPPMLEDYQEAWSIIDLSPKSSATLARRCLQAMIRDFCRIKERTLYHEIEKLRLMAEEDRLPRGVDPDTIEAMVALKDVGNIGAHMSEVDGIILDVEPGEAEKLLSLIEMLFEDWYVARGKRAQRIAGVLEVAGAKKPKPAEQDTAVVEDQSEGEQGV
jgi:hypothetical protein